MYISFRFGETTQYSKDAPQPAYRYHLDNIFSLVLTVVGSRQERQGDKIIGYISWISFEHLVGSTKNQSRISSKVGAQKMYRFKLFLPIINYLYVIVSL